MEMVNTFITDPDFSVCARNLDSRRLGKQRVEAYQILNILQDLRAVSDYHGWGCPGDDYVHNCAWIDRVSKLYRGLGHVLIHIDGKVEKVEREGEKVESKGKVITLKWATHTAVKMWVGYEEALKYYINCCIAEWTSRKNKDGNYKKNNMETYRVGEIKWPWWLKAQPIILCTKPV